MDRNRAFGKLTRTLDSHSLFNHHRGLRHVCIPSPGMSTTCLSRRCSPQYRWPVLRRQAEAAVLQPMVGVRFGGHSAWLTPKVLLRIHCVFFYSEVEVVWCTRRCTKLGQCCGIGYDNTSIHGTASNMTICHGGGTTDKVEISKRGWDKSCSTLRRIFPHAENWGGQSWTDYLRSYSTKWGFK